MNFPSREKLGRIVGLGLFCVMLARQFWHFPGIADLLSLTRWTLVTLLFTLFLLAYVKRRPAKSLAKGWVEMFFPLVCAALPFAVILGPYYLSFYFVKIFPDFHASVLLQKSWELYTLKTKVWGLSLMALGEVITVVGMCWLRSSFSIMSEVRDFVSTGIYRWLRHPLYSGEILSVWGYALAFPCHWTLTGAALFSILQGLRAKVEERKIMSQYPEYESYRRQTGFLFPKFW